jgi:hypothetical protein
MLTPNQPGVDLIKQFSSKFSHTFCKLDRFININNIYSIAMKWSSLQKRVSKFTPKMFYEIDTRDLHNKTLQICNLKKIDCL